MTSQAWIRRKIFGGLHSHRLKKYDRTMGPGTGKSLKRAVSSVSNISSEWNSKNSILKAISYGNLPD